MHTLDPTTPLRLSMPMVNSVSKQCKWQRHMLDLNPHERYMQLAHSQGAMEAAARQLAEACSPVPCPQKVQNCKYTA